MDTERPIAQLYAQEYEHAPACIVGNRKGLERLKLAIEAALEPGRNERVTELFAYDGEGYCVAVIATDADPAANHYADNMTAPSGFPEAAMVAVAAYRRSGEAVALVGAEAEEGATARRVRWKSNYRDLREMLFVVRVLRRQLGRDRPLVSRVPGGVQMTRPVVDLADVVEGRLAFLLKRLIDWPLRPADERVAKPEPTRPALWEWVRAACESRLGTPRLSSLSSGSLRWDMPRSVVWAILHNDGRWRVQLNDGDRGDTVCHTPADLTAALNALAKDVK